ncbi:MAG: YceI family protein, partial [Roseibium sp.]
GWIHHAATTGFAPIWWPFGQSLPFVPKDDIIAGWFAGLHHVLIAVLAVSVLLHVAGALKHHFIDKDATLRRMLLNAPEMPPLPAQNHGPAPVIVALIIWAAALGIGAMFGAYGDHRVSQNATALEVVQSQWVVQDGTIEFSVVQFGSSVAGSFANWTAEIGFDETIEEGPAGSVNVTIAIASLTLGSVTAQALGPDFFNSEEFPTARFEADILTSSETNVAEGTLTIKDRAIPVTLYFDLAVADGTAEMSGKLKLDRRDFGIGDNMPDETSLGFAVEVTVALTATNSTE